MSNWHDYEEFEYHGKKVEIIPVPSKFGVTGRWTYKIDGCERGMSYSKKNGAKISAVNRILKSEETSERPAPAITIVETNNLDGSITRTVDLPMVAEWLKEEQ